MKTITYRIDNKVTNVNVVTVKTGNAVKSIESVEYDGIKFNRVVVRQSENLRHYFSN